MDQYESVYRKSINNYLQCGEENIFFYWKGRVALFALLEAIGIARGDEVIVQGYTCVVVPNAILYLGAEPVYVDIDLDTFNMNIKTLEQKITDRTKVIICQNTYGLSSNLEKIMEIAQEASLKYGHKVYTIEDCTHGFGGSYHGMPNGHFCDASFFSTQWSKPYTTGVGGFCVVHGTELQKRLEEINKDLIQPNLKETAELQLMYFIRQYIVNDFTYWPMINLYRWLSHHNLVVGSSSGEEITGITIPEGFFKAQSSVQFQKGQKMLSKLKQVNQQRKHNAAKYTVFLRNNGKKHVSEALFDDHIFIRYPLLVNEREYFREKAEKAKVILGEWFEDPVYPADAPLKLWKVNPEELPQAMFACDHIVNLPTDVKDSERVIRFLSENLSMVL